MVEKVDHGLGGLTVLTQEKWNGRDAAVWRRSKSDYAQNLVSFCSPSVMFNVEMREEQNAKCGRAAE